MRNLFVLIILSIFISHTAAALEFVNYPGLSYKVMKRDHHTIHILTIDPKNYRLELVKSHNQVFGRETAKEIAIRTGAIAAVNAGFFEIGGSQDGRPSGTLVVNGQIMGMREKLQSLLILNQDNIQIKQAAPKLLLKIGEVPINHDRVNNFATLGSIVFYTSIWGPTTLTPYNYHEILIESDGTVSKISNHGDNYIPSNGFILSYPNIESMPKITEGEQITIQTSLLEADDTQSTMPLNMVMGIPQIVKNGKVDNLDKSDPLPNARTAIGTRSDGNIIIVLVEHTYKQDLKQVTLGQVHNILKNQPNSGMTTATLPEIRNILEKEFVSEDQTVGLSLVELAKLMIELKCVDAINLDGGGSSTMVIEGKIVNAITGDKDEKMGERVVRPVSDAIVIRKRDH